MNTTADRTHGPDTPIPAVADRHHAAYTGPPPYTPSWRELAESDEMRALVDLVAPQMVSTS